MRFHSRLHRAGCRLLLLALLVAQVPMAGAAECSPLAGPCYPNRLTYGYFPTKWRRWPGSQFAITPASQREEVPTPAQESKPAEPAKPTDEFDVDLPPQLPSDLPEPTTPSPEPSAPDNLEPPFGDAPSSPTDAEVPTPSGVVEPPFGDQPPSQPGVEPTPAMPDSSSPADAFPTPDAVPTPPGAAPAMPTDDPFKDDPDTAPAPTTPAGPGAAASTQATGEFASQLVLIPAAEVPAPPAIQPTARSNAPRLLSPARRAPQSRLLPEQAEGNPLRNSNNNSSAVRQTSLSGGTAATLSTTGAEERVWRRNPLRSN